MNRFPFFILVMSPFIQAADALFEIRCFPYVKHNGMSSQTSVFIITPDV